MRKIKREKERESEREREPEYMRKITLHTHLQKGVICIRTFIVQVFVPKVRPGLTEIIYTQYMWKKRSNLPFASCIWMQCNG